MHTTPPTLLDRLRQAGDEAAWNRLVDLYTPLLFGWARRCGQSPDDAADLVQEVFVALLQHLPEFREDRSGRFRRWLRVVLTNKLRDRRRRQAREEKAREGRGREAEPPEGERFWEVDYQKELARRALGLMKAEFAEATWKAFWETVVQGRPVAVVARELDLTENAVYIAKCRVVRRLREELSGLVE